MAYLYCDRPPKGWTCNLPRDHDGPCLAWPKSRTDAARHIAAIFAVPDALIGIPTPRWRRLAQKFTRRPGRG